MSDTDLKKSSDRRQDSLGKMLAMSVRASVSATTSIVSTTMGHCLQCQFKLSPWRRGQTKVQSKTLSIQIVSAASVYIGLSE